MRQPDEPEKILNGETGHLARFKNPVGVIRHFLVLVVDDAVDGHESLLHQFGMGRPQPLRNLIRTCRVRY